MRPLTESQQRVLDFIRVFCESHGFPPTHAEIARGLGFRSANAATDHVRRLARKGLLNLTPGTARGIRLLSSPPRRPAPRPPRARPAELPLIGQVAAGQPILAEEHVERTVSVAPELFHPRADYLLRVRGDSMIEAGILPHDLVAVHKTPVVSDDRIAVVRIEDEVTVKRWRWQGDAIVLEPANRELDPMVIDPHRTTVAVEGLVVGLLRLGGLEGGVS